MVSSLLFVVSTMGASGNYFVDPPAPTYRRVPFFWHFIWVVGAARAHSKSEWHPLIAAFEQIRLYYTTRGWNISYAIHDSQTGMVTQIFQNFVKRKGIMTVPLPSGDHAHRVERRQGFLKETCRVIKTGFPTSLPHSLVPWLVMHAEMQVNTTISQGNQRQKPPQLEIDGDSTLDYNYNRYFPCAFGDMSLAHKKSMVPDKAEDYAFEGIALFPSESKESGYNFLNLKTGAVAARSSYDVLPSYTYTYNYNERKILLRLYEKDIKKATRLNQLKGDVDSLANLRLDPTTATRVAYQER